MEKIYGDHINLLTLPGEAFFHPEFFAEEDSYMYLDRLTEEVEWKQEPIKMFGKEVLQPRFTAFYGDNGINYTYSGITMYPTPWTATLLKIKENIEMVLDTEFNACLLNHYRDGKDYMGWHRDNEKNLGKFPVIASVSFGASRIFQFRHYKDKLPIVSIELTHGSLLIMKGDTQQYWEHRLPKTMIDTQPRINLTFRMIKE